jgi:hypothetical protein
LIRRAALLLAGALALSAPALAAPEEGEEPQTSEPEAVEEAETPEEEDPISRYRRGFDELTERAIGTASMPVEFNWRRTNLHLAANGSFLFELNNFDSVRVGGLARLPSERMIVELGLDYAHVWNTPSSRILAMTPYRQPGRPSRLELDFALVLPLAEGVVTTSPRFFPPVQLVFNAVIGLRYSLYPGAFAEMKPGQVIGALFAPTLSEIEIDNLDDDRLDSMQTDLGRYGMLIGFNNDIYFKQGLFLSPRVLLAVPILAPITQTDLLVWADFSLAVGVAF